MEREEYKVSGTEWFVVVDFRSRDSKAVLGAAGIGVTRLSEFLKRKTTGMIEWTTDVPVEVQQFTKEIVSRKGMK